MQSVARSFPRERDHHQKQVCASLLVSVTHSLLAPSFLRCKERFEFTHGARLAVDSVRDSLRTKSECKPIRRTGQRPPGLRCVMSLCADRVAAVNQTREHIAELKATSRRERMDATRPISAAGGGAKAAHMLSGRLKEWQGAFITCFSQDLEKLIQSPAIKQGETLIRSESWAASTWISRRRKQPRSHLRRRRHSESGDVGYAA